jgi:hypothetical protein
LPDLSFVTRIALYTAAAVFVVSMVSKAVPQVGAFVRGA